jgi:hypothetical protein
VDPAQQHGVHQRVVGGVGDGAVRRGLPGDAQRVRGVGVRLVGGQQRLAGAGLDVLGGLDLHDPGAVRVGHDVLGGVLRQQARGWRQHGAVVAQGQPGGHRVLLGAGEQCLGGDERVAGHEQHPAHQVQGVDHPFPGADVRPQPGPGGVGGGPRPDLRQLAPDALRLAGRLVHLGAQPHHPRGLLLQHRRPPAPQPCDRHAAHTATCSKRVRVRWSASS